MKTLKLLNIFKGKKESMQLLDQVWEQTVKRHRNKGIWTMMKYLVVGFVLASQAALFFFIRRKNQNKNQPEPVEETKEVNDEISIEDFMFQKKIGKYILN